MNLNSVLFHMGHLYTVKHGNSKLAYNELMFTVIYCTIFLVYLDQKSKQHETKVEEEDEDDDDLLPVNTTVQKVEPPVQEVEQDHVQEKTTQPKKPQQTALEHEEDDEDSEWDSEVQSFTGIIL